MHAQLAKSADACFVKTGDATLNCRARPADTDGMVFCPSPTHASVQPRPARLRLWLLASLSTVLLAACGGGGGGTPSSDTKTSSDNQGAGSQAVAQLSAATPPTLPEAHRFLTQASFGPEPATVARLQSLGVSAWIDEQLAMPPSTPSHLSQVDMISNDLATERPRSPDLVASWWTHAIAQPDQLRQRVAYALSQIFVVSTQNSALGDNARMVAAYLDMLTDKSTGTYRDLLEGVTRHPAMGIYLSHLMNRKEDTLTGRVPDENFAREVMQLFSIGLHELNDDGNLKLRDGKPIETYTPDDVKGLAKAFTGLGWHRPNGYSGIWWLCFYSAGDCHLPQQQYVLPMSTYWQEHSSSPKHFLGVTIDAQSPPDPETSLRIALDRLANHPNTAPFISKQLIQRLVSSNPSPAYVARITQVFRSSGGQLRAVVKAILTDPESRTTPVGLASNAAGKLREPVLRWAHLLRAMPHTSTHQVVHQNQKYYLATDTSNPAYGLGQTPMASPSAFNFYRPGYKPPRTGLSQQGLVSPEMQITDETTVVGYANFVARSLSFGWGWDHSSTGKPDIQFDLSRFMALDDATHAVRPQPMVDAVALQLLGKTLPSTLNEQVLAAVGAMPRGNAGALRRRAAAAVLLIAVSPPFLVQQ